MPAAPTISPDIDTGTDIGGHEEHAQLFNVVLLDDDDHTYDYVIEMLSTLFHLTVDQAYQHAVEVDQAGRTTVMTCELGPAEFARDQIHGYGADWRMRSSWQFGSISEAALKN